MNIFHSTLDPIKDGTSWYDYCGSDPVNFVDLWGLDTLIINMPGSTNAEYETALNALETNPELVEGSYGLDFTEDFTVISPENVTQLSDQLNIISDDVTDIIINGGHGSSTDPRIGGIDANDIDPSVDVDDDVYVWLNTCHQGNFEDEWADALGVPESNVFGYPAISNAQNSANFMVDVLTGQDPNSAFQEYLYQNDAWNAAGRSGESEISESCND